MSVSKPILLNIESSTDICSVCLSRGEQILALKESTDRYAHASVITIFIQEVTEEAQLSLNQVDAIVISQGPGSYTALRIGTATAKGICYALNKPLIAIDTLQALAWASQQQVSDKQALYFPMIDARRMEVYTAGFNIDNGKEVETHALIVDESSFQQYIKDNIRIILGGNGAEKCKAVLQHPNFLFQDIRCSATYLVPLALSKYEKNDWENLAYFAPQYFKSPNITKPKKIL